MEINNLYLGIAGAAALTVLVLGARSGTSQWQRYIAAVQRLNGRKLLASQIQSIVGICEAWKKEGDGDERKLIYILATSFHESRLQNIAERRDKPSGKVWKMQEAYWHTGYYGRGLSQLTWRLNYEQFGRLLGIDLVGNPDLALKPDVGAKILVIGMVRGLFRKGHSLARYFAKDKEDVWNARNITNGGLFNTDKITDHYWKLKSYLK